MKTPLILQLLFHFQSFDFNSLKLFLYLFSVRKSVFIEGMLHLRVKKSVGFIELGAETAT